MTAEELDTVNLARLAGWRVRLTEAGAMPFITIGVNTDGHTVICFCEHANPEVIKLLLRRSLVLLEAKEEGE